MLIKGIANQFMRLQCRWLGLIKYLDYICKKSISINGITCKFADRIYTISSINSWAYEFFRADYLHSDAFKLEPHRSKVIDLFLGLLFNLF